MPPVPDNPAGGSSASSSSAAALPMNPDYHTFDAILDGAATSKTGDHAPGSSRGPISTTSFLAQNSASRNKKKPVDLSNLLPENMDQIDSESRPAGGGRSNNLKNKNSAARSGPYGAKSTTSSGAPAQMLTTAGEQMNTAQRKQASGKAKARPKNSSNLGMNKSSTRGGGNGTSSRTTTDVYGSSKRKIHPDTEELYNAWHGEHNYEQEKQLSDSLKKYANENIDKSDLLHMASKFLDIFDVLRLRCVNKDMYKIKPDSRQLKMKMIKKLARILDFGANCPQLDLNVKMANECPGFYTNHFDREGTPFMRGVCLYTSDERMRCSWVERYLFSDLAEWNPDPAKEPFESLKRLWDFQTKRKVGGVASTTLLLNDAVPNRTWQVEFVKPRRWQEIVQASCPWKVKLLALVCRKIEAIVLRHVSVPFWNIRTGELRITEVRLGTVVIQCMHGGETSRSFYSVLSA
ncbi:unnamed protein product [Amoebophrya sp. A120]|nr:unnamed protein product [Amoebophrya sp. A120]|eukprot:GSA120T00007393001.1